MLRSLRVMAAIYWAMHCHILGDACFHAAYMYSIVTIVHADQLCLQMPFSKFIRTARGGYLQSQLLLEHQFIKSIGFLLADDVTGPFQLEIDYIKLIKIPYCVDFDKMDRRRPQHTNLMSYEDL